MFKRLSISQGIVFVMMAIVTFALIVANVMHYMLFNSSTAEVISTSSREINKQVIMNYENYIDQVIETSNYLNRQTIELTFSNQQDDLESIYIQASQMSKDIVSVILFDETGNVFILGDDRNVTINVSSESWFISAVHDKDIFHFSSPHTEVIFGNSPSEVITVTKSIKYYDNGELNEGILMIDLNTENLIDLAQKTNLGINGHILILNDESEFVYSSLSTCTDITCDSKQVVDEIILGGESVILNGDHMYVNINTLKNTRWRIATFINMNTIYETRQTMYLLESVVFGGALLLSLFFSMFLAKRISNPLVKLQDHMAKMEKEGLMEEIYITGQKEVVSLSDTFNHMIVEINQLLNRLVTEQKEKRKSEFLALQTQINPHFLYNTLDSIVWLAENNQNKEVIEMVIALSRFFRISISRGKNTISVKDELEHARQYLLIQKIRYNKKFDFEFFIDPEIYEYSTVKLILQPIIENAISHGVNTEFGTGHITIKAYIHNQKLKFEVENNGYGITEEKIESLYQSMKNEDKANSVGLRNVYQRLKLYYGEDADIIITSILDQMTNVKLILPLRKDIQDEKSR